MYLRNDYWQHYEVIYKRLKSCEFRLRLQILCNEKGIAVRCRHIVRRIPGNRRDNIFREHVLSKRQQERLQCGIDRIRERIQRLLDRHL